MKRPVYICKPIWIPWRTLTFHVLILMQIKVGHMMTQWRVETCRLLHLSEKYSSISVLFDCTLFTHPNVRFLDCATVAFSGRNEGVKLWWRMLYRRLSVWYASSHRSFWRLSDVLDVIYQDIQKIGPHYALKRTGGFCLSDFLPRTWTICRHRRMAYRFARSKWYRQMDLQKVFL
jgi:hypothetical protein